MLSERLKMVTALLLGLSLWGGLSGHPALAQDRVAMATPVKSFSFLITYVALNRGFFKEQGLDVKMLVMKTNLAMTAMVAGQVDYATPTGTAVRSALQGMPVRVIFYETDKSIFYFFVNPKVVRSPQDLKGKVIGVSSFGATTDYAARLSLRHFGLDPDRDATIIQVGEGNNRFLTLKAGSVVATTFTPPENLMAEDLGFKSILFVGEVLQTPTGGLATSVAKIRTKREEVKRLLKAAVIGSRFVRNNREGSIEAIMQEWQFDRQMAARSYDAVIKAIGQDGLVPEAALRTEIEAPKERLKITRPVAPEEVTDFGPLREVLRGM